MKTPEEVLHDLAQAACDLCFAVEPPIATEGVLLVIRRETETALRDYDELFPGRIVL